MSYDSKGITQDSKETKRQVTCHVAAFEEASQNQSKHKPRYAI